MGSDLGAMCHLAMATFSEALAMRDWSDFGIKIPYGSTGELRMPCPQCSASRRKNHDTCLAVNVDKGTWKCWHCGWTGGLHGCPQARILPRNSRPSVPPDEWKLAALRRVWREAAPLAVDDLVSSVLAISP